MNRGDIWWLKEDSARVGEAQGTRPCIIVSNDVACRVMNRVQVVPLTRNVSRVYPGEALVMVGETPSKALATQIQTVDKSRLLNRIGQVASAEMVGVNRALRTQLALGPW